MKVLIYQEYSKGGQTDIDRVLDYNVLYKDVRTYCNGVWTNAGNKVWIQGIVSELSTEDNEVRFLEREFTWDYINSYFDVIVFSTANLLYRLYKDDIEQITKEFQKSRIPIFCISMGAQAGIDEEPGHVAEGMESTISAFLDAIYSSGGEIGVRGWYTKEVLDAVMKNSAAVIGCPGLYQNGPNLSISNEKISFQDFSAAINGDIFFSKQLVCEKTVFLDQTTYPKELYDVEYYERTCKGKIVYNLVKKCGVEKAELLLSGKVKLFMDVPQWHDFLGTTVNFTYGGRIHGNIISILSGIPALIYPVDKRVAEIAEFYHIPYTTKKPENIRELYDLYLETDYTMFNDVYPDLYHKYESFLRSCGLVREKMNDNNKYWGRQLPSESSVIENKKKDAFEYLKKHHGFMVCVDDSLKWIRKLRG